MQAQRVHRPAVENAGIKYQNGTIAPAAALKSPLDIDLYQHSDGV